MSNASAKALFWRRRITEFLVRMRGRGGDKVSFDVAGDIFYRSLGFIYLSAFVSLWTQIDGLAGSRGILPAADLWRAALEHQIGFFQLPTVCHWMGASDAALHAMCAAGSVSAVLMVAGVLPPVSAALAWLCYLSLCSVVRTFLNFQWDAMLLEAGFLAIFLWPPVLWLDPRRPRRVSRLARWLLVWLLFRLMFAAGIVKLASRDPAWWDLSALTFHYWTQCLPPWTAWHFDKLPLWAHKACCFVMFVIELAVPFCVFGPRRLRHFAAVCFLLLMAVILASGNYGFFDLLTCALCLLLIDDAAWRKLFRRPAGTPSHDTAVARWTRCVCAPMLLLVFALTWLPFSSAVVSAQTICGIASPLEPPRPAWLEKLYGFVAPFRSINGYGLFAVMTKQRDEIILEGTDDGVTWKAYAFRWKPGDVHRRPAFCVPHMPRLDWQMWFAALGEIRGNPWLVNTMVRLLEGEPAVLDLLADNPFPDRPPRALRAVVYGYRFTTAEERRATGAWWKRAAAPRIYCPPLQLQRPPAVEPGPGTG